MIKLIRKMIICRRMGFSMRAAFDKLFIKIG